MAYHMQVKQNAMIDEAFGSPHDSAAHTIEHGVAHLAKCYIDNSPADLDREHYTSAVYTAIAQSLDALYKLKTPSLPLRPREPAVPHHHVYAAFMASNGDIKQGYIIRNLDKSYGLMPADMIDATQHDENSIAR